MKKSKYDPLDVTNRLYDLNFEKYTQLHYGNLKKDDKPSNGNTYGYPSDNTFNGTKVNATKIRIRRYL